jgi:hypothetical protein
MLHAAQTTDGPTRGQLDAKAARELESGAGYCHRRAFNWHATPAHAGRVARSGRVREARRDEARE